MSSTPGEGGQGDRHDTITLRTARHTRYVIQPTSIKSTYTRTLRWTVLYPLPTGRDPSAVTLSLSHG